MKRLIKKVELVFFNDDANGMWGLAHKSTHDDNSAFNAFWNGTGIFHDVFEHSHEKEHKYFQGDYAMNVGGEMAAMGSMFYYIDELGISNRLRNNYHGNGVVMRESTLSDVQEAISSGYCNYGYTLESNVPKQRPIDNGEFEYQLGEYYNQVKKFEVSDNSEQETEFSKGYKESVTFRKIADLHRYGYRMAERLVPNKYDNRTTLSTFIAFWNDFTQKNEAETLQNDFDGLTFYLYKDENGFVSWKAILEARYPMDCNNAVITENTKHFSVEDYWNIPSEDEN